MGIQPPASPTYHDMIEMRRYIPPVAKERKKKTFATLRSFPLSRFSRFLMIQKRSDFFFVIFHPIASPHEFFPPTFSRKKKLV